MSTIPEEAGLEEEDVDPVFSAPVSSERSEVLYTPEDQIIPSDEQLPEAIKSMPKWQRDKIIRDRSSGKKPGSHSTGSKLVVRGSSRISLSPDKSPPKSHLATPTRKISRSTPEQEMAMARAQREVAAETRTAVSNLYKREASDWIAKLFDLDVHEDNLFEHLMDGVLLCKLAAKVTVGEMEWRGSRERNQSSVTDDDDQQCLPAVVAEKAFPKAPKPLNPRGHKAIARDNCHKFIEWCKGVGLPEEVLFESEDLVGFATREAAEGKVLTCLLDVARLSHNIWVPSVVEKERKYLADVQGLLEAELAREAAAEERARLAAEEEARLLAEAEARRVAAEEARLAAEEAARVEEEARLAAEAEAARVEAEHLAKLKALEEARLAAEAEKKRIEEEARLVEQRRLAEEARVAAEAEAARLAKLEEARLAREEAARLQAEAEAEVARLAAEAARLKAEAEAEVARLAAEAEAARVAELEAARVAAELLKRQALEEAARLAAEEEAARLKAEAERIAEERRKLEEEVRLERERLEKLRLERIAAEEERKEAERLRAEAEAKRDAERKAAEEAARRAAEEEAKRKAEEERLRLETEARLRAEQEAAAEAARLAAEAEARRVAQLELQRLKAEAEAAAKRAADEEARRKMAAEIARLLAEEDAAMMQHEAELAALAEEERLALEAAHVRKAEADALHAARDVAITEEKEAATARAEAERARAAAGKVDADAAAAVLEASMHEAAGKAEAGRLAKLQLEEDEQRVQTEGFAKKRERLASVLRVQSNHAKLLRQQQEKLAAEQELAKKQSEEERLAALERAKVAQDEADRMAAEREREEKRLRSAKHNKDALDVEVRKVMHKMETTVQLVKLRSGTYLIKGTTKKIFVRILNTVIMVRVGGGWEKLEKWLVRNKPQLSEKSKSDAKKRLEGRVSNPITGAQDATFTVGTEDRRGNTTSTKSSLVTASKRISAAPGEVLVLGADGGAADADIFDQAKTMTGQSDAANAAYDDQAAIVAGMRQAEARLKADAAAIMSQSNTHDADELSKLADATRAVLEETQKRTEEEIGRRQAEVDELTTQLADSQDKTKAELDQLHNDVEAAKAEQESLSAKLLALKLEAVQQHEAGEAEAVAIAKAAHASALNAKQDLESDKAMLDLQHHEHVSGKRLEYSQKRNVHEQRRAEIRQKFRKLILAVEEGTGAATSLSATAATFSPDDDAPSTTTTTTTSPTPVPIVPIVTTPTPSPTTATTATPSPTTTTTTTTTTTPAPAPKEAAAASASASASAATSASASASTATATATAPSASTTTGVKLQQELALGDRVATVLGEGSLSWIGLADFSRKGKDQKWCGIIMDRSNAAFHDGSFDGKQYFECPTGRGMFCKPTKVTVLRHVTA